MRCLGTIAAAIAVLVALSATAQEPGRVYRIGVLSPSTGSVESVRRYTLPELARLGFAEGRNLIVEERSTEGVADKLAPIARALFDYEINGIVAPPPALTEPAPGGGE